MQHLFEPYALVPHSSNAVNLGCHHHQKVNPIKAFTSPSGRKIIAKTVAGCHPSRQHQVPPRLNAVGPAASSVANGRPGIVVPAARWRNSFACRKPAAVSPAKHWKICMLCDQSRMMPPEGRRFLPASKCRSLTLKQEPAAEGSNSRTMIPRWFSISVRDAKAGPAGPSMGSIKTAHVHSSSNSPDILPDSVL